MQLPQLTFQKQVTKNYACSDILTIPLGTWTPGNIMTPSGDMLPRCLDAVTKDCFPFSPGGRRWPLRPDEGEFTAIHVLIVHPKSVTSPSSARSKEKKWNPLRHPGSSYYRRSFRLRFTPDTVIA